MNMAGQTINDRLLAARHSLAGQGLAKSVCKATTEEMIGPKKKHLDCKFSFNSHLYFFIPFNLEIYERLSLAATWKINQVKYIKNRSVRTGLRYQRTRFSHDLTDNVKC